MTTPNLWLVGMMGSGKSEVGPLIAERLGLGFTDTDAAIEAAHGRSVARLWEELGEAGFRELEAAEISRLAAPGGRVIATGGGAVLRPANSDAMRRSGPVVWLDAPAEALVERLGSGEGRPLLREGPARLAAILEDRRGAYARAAHHRVDTKGMTPSQVAALVVGLWNAS